MLDPKLVDYVSRYLRSGYSPDQVRKTLLDAGWPRDMVDEAIRQETSKVSPVPTPQIPVYPGRAQEKAPEGIQKPPGVLRRLHAVLLHPNQFFELVKPEKGYAPPLKFYLLISIINIILSSLILLSYPNIETTSQLSLLGSVTGIDPSILQIINMITSVLISIVFTFIAAFFIHIFALLFGAKKGYINTYKATVYSSAVSILLWPSILLSSVNLLLAISLLGVYFIWSFILEIKALSRLHEISAARAFAIIATPIVIGVMVLIFVLLSAVLFFFGAFEPTSYTTTMTGFSLLGPEDWDVSSNGDVRIMLSNMLSNEATIYSITAATGAVSDTWSTEGCSGPGTYLTIAPVGAADLSTACPNLGYDLNIGPQAAGSSYSLDISIHYNSGGFDEIETGKLTGTVS